MTMKQMTKLSFLSVFVMALIVMSGAAYAMDLQSARNSGAVGERLDGYVAVLKASPDVNALVDDVNGKRKVEYARIAQGNGQAVDVVAKLAAAQIIQHLSAGHFYQAADGSWKQK